MSTAAPQDTAYITFVADINDVGCRTLLSTVSSLVAAGKQEIHLLMASTGGNVMHGFSAYNGLRALPVKLVTHNIGNIDSISNVVFMSADDRYANAHSTFMFHGVAMQVNESLSQTRAKDIAAGLAADEKRIADVIAKHTTLTPTEIKTFFSQAVTMTAGEAHKAGIVTSVTDVHIPAGAQTLVLT